MDIKKIITTKRFHPLCGEAGERVGQRSVAGVSRTGGRADWYSQAGGLLIVVTRLEPSDGEGISPVL
jgi:hypothetical protein